MRVAVLLALLWLGGCASEKLALSPPPGVDFNGHWRLNEADSDDPQRLVLSDNERVSRAASPGGAAGGGGAPGGGQGRGGRGNAGAQGGFGTAVSLGPALPAVGALSDGLRWPGKELDIKQVGGVLAITSGGYSRVFQPTGADKQVKTSNAGPRDRSEGPPAICGWDGKTWVLRTDGREDDRAAPEKRYEVSADGRRLIEVVAFKGGRSAGFTATRVWDRGPP